MSAVNEIEAAIVRLADLRKSCYGNALDYFEGDLVATDGKINFPVFSVHESSRDYFGRPDDGANSAGELLVTLYRTIDEQLALFTVAHKAYQHYSTGNSHPLDADRTALALARAINGTA